MKRRNLKGLLAYIYMPVIFALTGYGLVYLAARPLLVTARDVGSMFVSDKTPGGGKAVDSIFVEPETEKASETKSPEPDTLESENPGAETSAAEDPEEAPAKDLAENPVLPEKTVPLSEVVWPSYGQHYGELSCEAVGLKGSVYYGDDNEILRDGIGQFNGSFIPGYGRTLLLCAHNTTYFAPLQDIKEGDIVTFKTSYGIYEYKITSTKVRDHVDEEAYDLLQKKEELVLYTCYPFERLAGLTKTDRLFVYGEKISGPDLVQGEEEEGNGTKETEGK